MPPKVYSSNSNDIKLKKHLKNSLISKGKFTKKNFWLKNYMSWRKNKKWINIRRRSREIVMRGSLGSKPNQVTHG